MKVIEKGKNFNEKLSIDDMSKIQGGGVCFRVKQCNCDKVSRISSCGILIGDFPEGTLD